MLLVSVAAQLLIFGGNESSAVAGRSSGISVRGKQKRKYARLTKIISSKISSNVLKAFSQTLCFVLRIAALSQAVMPYNLRLQ